MKSGTLTRGWRGAAVVATAVILAGVGCSSEPEPLPPAEPEPAPAPEPMPAEFGAPVPLQDATLPAAKLVAEHSASTPMGVRYTLRNLDLADPMDPVWVTDGTPAGTRPLGLADSPSLDASLRREGYALGAGGLWRQRGDVPGGFAQVLPGVSNAVRLGSRFIGVAGRYATGYELIAADEGAVPERLLFFPPWSWGDRPPPRFLAEAGGLWYLDDGAGRLSVTDGTPAGTRLLQAVPAGTSIFQVVSVGPRIVFLARAGSSYEAPVRPWASDGTEAGTYEVVDLSRFSINSYGTPMLSTGSVAVFLAHDETSGYELRATDGTRDSYRTLTDLCGTTGCSAGLKLLGRAGGRVLFVARDGTGLGLWGTDGSAEGTRVLARGSDITDAVSVGDVAYVGGSSLWRTDGTVEGTRVLEAAWTRLFEPADGRVPYVRGWGGASAELGSVTEGVAKLHGAVPPRAEVLGRAPVGAWVLSDSPSTLFTVAEADGARTELPLPPLGGGSQPSRLTVTAQDVLFFNSVQPGTFSVRDLMRAGPEAGPPQVVDRGSPPGCPDCPGRAPLPLGTVGDSFLFGSAAGAFTGLRPDGTQVAIPVPRASVTQARLGDALVLFANGKPPSLWTLDAAEAARHVFTFPVTTEFEPALLWVRQEGGRVFVKMLANHWQQLWVVGADGKGECVAQQRDTGHILDVAAVLPGVGVVYNCSSEATGVELCVSDGTPAGTRLLRDVRPGAEGAHPGTLILVAGRVYFTADDGKLGREVWVTDGTEAGTRVAVDLVPGSGSSSPAALAGGATRLYFRAWTPERGFELWTLGPDGTATPLTDSMPGPLDGFTSGAIAVRESGDWLVFAARTSEHGEELWGSDGTPAGTRLLHDVLPGPASSSPRELVLGRSHLFFRATDAQRGPVPWRLPFH